MNGYKKTSATNQKVNKTMTNKKVNKSKVNRTVSKKKYYQLNKTRLEKSIDKLIRETKSCNIIKNKATLNDNVITRTFEINKNNGGLEKKQIQHVFSKLYDIYKTANKTLIIELTLKDYNKNVIHSRLPLYINGYRNYDAPSFEQMFHVVDNYDGTTKNKNDDINMDYNNITDAIFRVRSFIFQDPIYLENNQYSYGNGAGKSSSYCFYKCLMFCGVLQQFINVEVENGVIKENGFKLFENTLDEKYNCFKHGIVNVADVPKVEDFIKINIFVNGQSENKYKKSIHLRYFNNHFDIERLYSKFQMNSIWMKNRKLNDLIKTSNKEFRLIYVIAVNFVLFVYDKYDNTCDISTYSKLKDKYNEMDIIFVLKYIKLSTKNLKHYKEIVNNKILDDVEKKLESGKFSTIFSTLKEYADNYELFYSTLRMNGIVVPSNYYLSDEELIEINVARFFVDNINVSTIDRVCIEELPIIEGAINGALHYIKDKEKHDVVYEYDVKSAYPSLLSNYNGNIIDKEDNLKIICNEGVFGHITLEDFNNAVKNHTLNYGFYKLKLKPSNEDNLLKYSNISNNIVSDNNWYTHYDIYSMVEDNYGFELLEEETKDENNNEDENKEENKKKPESGNSSNENINNDTFINTYYWTKDNLFDSGKIFKTYNDLVMHCREQLKDKPLAKSIIKAFNSKVWGATFSLKKKIIYINSKDHLKNNHYNKFDFDENNKYYINENEFLYNYNGKTAIILNKNLISKNVLYRMKPFMLAIQKYYMIRAIKKYNIRDNLIKINTDAFYVDRKIEELEPYINSSEYINNKLIYKDGFLTHERYFEGFTNKNMMHYETDKIIDSSTNEIITDNTKEETPANDASVEKKQEKETFDNVEYDPNIDFLLAPDDDYEVAIENSNEISDDIDDYIDEIKADVKINKMHNNVVLVEQNKEKKINDKIEKMKKIDEYRKQCKENAKKEKIQNAIDKKNEILNYRVEFMKNMKNISILTDSYEKDEKIFKKIVIEDEKYNKYFVNSNNEDFLKLNFDDKIKNYNADDNLYNYNYEKLNEMYCMKGYKPTEISILNRNELHDLFHNIIELYDQQFIECGKYIVTHIFKSITNVNNKNKEILLAFENTSNVYNNKVEILLTEFALKELDKSMGYINIFINNKITKLTFADFISNYIITHIKYAQIIEDPSLQMSYYNKGDDKFIINRCICNEKDESKLKILYNYISANPLRFKDISNTYKNIVFNIIDHIENVLCSNENIIKDYVMQLFLASILHVKVNYGVIFSSNTGTGKSLITEIIGFYAIGNKYFDFNNDISSLIVNNKNVFYNKYLICMEEVANDNVNRNNNVNNIIKSVITSGKITLTEKYEKSKIIENKTNLIFNTNKKEPFKIDENDRRFVIPLISEKFRMKGCNDENKLNNCKNRLQILKCFDDSTLINSTETRELVGYALILYALDNFDHTYINKIVPETSKHKKEMMNKNTSTFDQTLIYLFIKNISKNKISKIQLIDYINNNIFEYLKIRDKLNNKSYFQKEIEITNDIKYHIENNDFVKSFAVANYKYSLNIKRLLEYFKKKNIVELIINVVRYILNTDNIVITNDTKIICKILITLINEYGITLFDNITNYQIILHYMLQKYDCFTDKNQIVFDKADFNKYLKNNNLMTKYNEQLFDNKNNEKEKDEKRPESGNSSIENINNEIKKADNIKLEDEKKNIYKKIIDTKKQLINLCKYMSSLYNEDENKYYGKAGEYMKKISYLIDLYNELEKDKKYEIINVRYYYCGKEKKTEYVDLNILKTPKYIHNLKKYTQLRCVESLLKSIDDEIINYARNDELMIYDELTEQEKISLISTTTWFYNKGRKKINKLETRRAQQRSELMDKDEIIEDQELEIQRLREEIAELKNKK